MYMGCQIYGVKLLGKTLNDGRARVTYERNRMCMHVIYAYAVYAYATYAQKYDMYNVDF